MDLAHLATREATAIADRHPDLDVVLLVAPKTGGTWMGAGSNAPPDIVDRILIASVRMQERVDFMPTMPKGKR